MQDKDIISIFKCKLDSSPFGTLENKPEGALLIWGLRDNLSGYDFQHYLDYIRDAIENNKKY